MDLNYEDEDAVPYTIELEDIDKDILGFEHSVSDPAEPEDMSRIGQRPLRLTVYPRCQQRIFDDGFAIEVPVRDRVQAEKQMEHFRSVLLDEWTEAFPDVKLDVVVKSDRSPPDCPACGIGLSPW